MLRDWQGESHATIYEILARFGLRPSDIHLLKYEALTPDSFIWFLELDGVRYCLYAEDYVPSIAYVEKVMKDNHPDWHSGDSYKLVRVKNPEIWEESSPVRSATTYKPPVDTEEFMQYATTSGIDFVFLGSNHDS
jgi:hypothetical protein